jgi:hypothetical protein
MRRQQPPNTATDSTLSATTLPDSINLQKITNLQIQLKKYEKLNEHIMSMLTVNLDNFREGMFSDVDTTKNREIGQLLVDDNIFSKATLANVSNYIYKPATFDEYILHLHRVLDGLIQALILHKTNVVCENNNLNYEGILKDKDSISAYLIKRYGGNSIFGDEISRALTVNPQLKKQYAVYVERHGFPDNMLFKSELISEIIKELVDAGETVD